MKKMDYRIPEESEVHLYYNEKGQVEIYKTYNQGPEAIKVMQKVKTVPAKDLEFIEEVKISPLKSYLIYAYRATDSVDYTIEKLEIIKGAPVLTAPTIMGTTSEYPYIIYPGIYCFRQNGGGTLTLMSYSEKSFAPEQICVRHEQILQYATRVTFSNLELNPEKNNFVEMCLHFEPKEVVHAILKLSTEPYNEIKAYSHVWSEMSSHARQEYELWHDPRIGEYASADYFKKTFETSQLSAEIAYENEQARKQKETSLKKIREKMKPHFKDKKS